MNIPTVPGDVLVGFAAIACGYGVLVTWPPVVAACVASVGLYLFGLADNDIVGAKTDGLERPIPAGQISIGAARGARGLCLFSALIAGAVGNLPPMWWMAAFLLSVAMVVYNRTKSCVVMGLCRGLNVVCGGAVALPVGFAAGLGLVGFASVVLVWIAYIAAVTKYSDGEGTDPAKRRRVGLLIGAIVYLQLAALLVFFLLRSTVFARNLLLVGAGMLLVLRILKRSLPKVSAS